MDSDKASLKMVLNRLLKFEQAAFDYLISRFKTVELKRGTAFVCRGEYAKKIAFVVEGVLRAYYSNDQGTEYNKTFFVANDFVGAYSALVTGKPNLIDIDCLTNCKLLVADYSSITSKYDTYPVLERLARIQAEMFFVNKEKREIELVTMDAKDRYEIFKQDYPDLEQRIPQYHIASYLGVSPTQLSRIRAKK